MPRQDIPPRRNAARVRSGAKQSRANIQALAKAASAELAAISKAAGRERAAAVILALADAVLARSGHSSSQHVAPSPSASTANAAKLQADVNAMHKRLDQIHPQQRGGIRPFPRRSSF